MVSRMHLRKIVGETVAQAVEASRYRRTAERVQRMFARLYTDGFAAFG